MSYHPNPRFYGSRYALGAAQAKEEGKEKTVQKIVQPDFDGMSAYEAADVRLRMESEKRERKTQIWSNLATIASAVVPIVTLFGIDQYLRIQEKRKRRK